jgi:hypothetical protein
MHQLLKRTVKKHNMSNKTLLGAAMPNIYYNAINAEPIATEPVTEPVSVLEQARMDRFKERQLKTQKECCIIMLACPFIMLLVLFKIYVIFIIGAIICVSIKLLHQCMEYALFD